MDLQERLLYSLNNRFGWHCTYNAYEPTLKLCTLQIVSRRYDSVAEVRIGPRPCTYGISKTGNLIHCNTLSTIVTLTT